jgi:hypothetical protein
MIIEKINFLLIMKTPENLCPSYCSSFDMGKAGMFLRGEYRLQLMD